MMHYCETNQDRGNVILSSLQGIPQRAAIIFINHIHIGTLFAQHVHYSRQMALNGQLQAAQTFSRAAKSRVISILKVLQLKLLMPQLQIC